MGTKELTELYSRLKSVLLSGSKNKINQTIKNFSRLNDRKKLTLFIALPLVLILIIGLPLMGKSSPKDSMSMNISSFMESSIYKVSYNGTEIGLVRDIDEVNVVKDKIIKDLEDENGLSVVINGEFVFTKTSDGGPTLSTEEIESRLRETVDFRTTAFAIVVDGEVIGALRTQKEAEEVLEEIKKPFIVINKSNFVEKAEFLERVEIVEASVAADKILDSDTCLKILTKGTLEEKVHVVQKGENPWIIARDNNITEDDILKANPGLNPKSIQIGQKLSLVVPKPYVTVVTKEKTVMTENIPNKTVTNQSNTIYRGETRVQQAGRVGLREIEAYIYKQNGIEIKEKREILGEKVVREPVDRIVIAGTMAPPPRIGTGTFAMPSRGNITSPFGPRWGVRHNGIDIAAPIGTDIRAADGGRVIFSGWKGSFGNLIIIDHGEGFESYYGHNSENLVKTGDSVFKGQLIGRVGNTGYSTGPHVHFEIRKFGVPVNPQDYVK